jgi:hypothetical protein
MAQRHRLSLNALRFIPLGIAANADPETFARQTRLNGTSAHSTEWARLHPMPLFTDEQAIGAMVKETATELSSIS